MEKTIRASSGHPSKAGPTTHWSGVSPRRESQDKHKAVTTFHLQHSEIVVQQSPVGYIARIEHDRPVLPTPEYAGPLSRATVMRLSEVAR